MSQLDEQINQSTNLRRTVTQVANYGNIEKEVLWSIVAKFKYDIENKLVFKPKK